MPSGKIHDAFTFLSTIPVFLISWMLAGSVSGSVITIGFILGGLVFGPDLDTASRQYNRWGFLRFLWFPYNRFFSHRSRWSHGLIFGTLFRVIYFAGVTTIFSFVLTFALSVYFGSKLPDFTEFIETWNGLARFVKSNLGDYAILYTFLGLWLGAASHTITDIAGSYIKTGRSKGLF